jgi:membrane-associated protease RseP (regulator of RpoE activity)
VIVAHVDPATPAAKAGIEVGDVIVDVRGRRIDSAADVLSAIEDVGKGEHVKITLVRDRASRSLDATLTNNGTTNARWSPPWLLDWMKPFDSHQRFSTPFEEPPWFRHWLRPHDQTKTDTDSEMASSWLRKLRELFGPKSSGPSCQRS